MMYGWQASWCIRYRPDLISDAIPDQLDRRVLLQSRWLSAICAGTPVRLFSSPSYDILFEGRSGKRLREELPTQQISPPQSADLCPIHRGNDGNVKSALVPVTKDQLKSIFRDEMKGL